MKELIYQLDKIDKKAFEWALVHANPNWLVSFCDFVVQNRNIGFALIALFGYLLYKDNKYAMRIILSSLLLLALSDFASSILKDFFERPRPIVQMGIYTMAGSFSFPSAHAMNSMGFSIIMGSFYPEYRKRWLLFTLAIGLARTTAHYHFPGDILGGWAIGYALARSFVWIMQRYTTLYGRPAGSQVPAEQ